jgi:hypothetical protein
MKRVNPILFLTAMAFAYLPVYAQGPFQNLDFEQANPVITTGSPFYFDEVTAASALPDWTVTIGGVPQPIITENDPTTGSPWVSLVGPGDHFGYAPIDGNYSVLLQGSISAAAISQSAMIPALTESLLFEAQPGFGTLDVTVGSQVVPFTQLGTGPNYILYGANISAWSGDTEQITFSALGGSVFNQWELDDISFSQTAATPEANTLVLTGIGGLLFALYRRFTNNG